MCIIYTRSFPKCGTNYLDVRGNCPLWLCFKDSPPKNSDPIKPCGITQPYFSCYWFHMSPVEVITTVLYEHNWRSTTSSKMAFGFLILILNLTWWESQVHTIQSSSSSSSYLLQSSTTGPHDLLSFGALSNTRKWTSVDFRPQLNIICGVNGGTIYMYRLQNSVRAN